ncbi:MAG: C39 family peptidase [Phycisphaerales bacterium]|nr:C39 family peptidase [Phycisphaerales bacterium]MCB9862501.1 C39 family peptidase [Phycisphaerales bacterium]
MKTPENAESWQIDITTQLPTREVEARVGETILEVVRHDVEKREFRIDIQDVDVTKVIISAEHHLPITIERPRLGQPKSTIRLRAKSVLDAANGPIATLLRIERSDVRLLRGHLKLFVAKHWGKLVIVGVALVVGIFLYHFSPEVAGRIPRVVDRDITLIDGSIEFGQETIIQPSARLVLHNIKKVKMPPNAVIIVLGEFVVSSDTPDPIEFDPSADRDTKWQGIHAIGDNARLELRNARIADACGTDPKQWPSDFVKMVRGVYESEVKIRRGGGCSVTRAYVRLEHVQFDRCEALKGGALFLNDTPRLLKGAEVGPPIPRSTRNLITSCEFTNNACGASNYKSSGGGAVFLYLAAATIQDTVFSENRTRHPSGAGGAVYVGNSSIAELDGCTFANNNATGDGGGVYIRGTYEPGSILRDAAVESFVNIRNCEFTGNSASGRGGALAASKLTIPKITDCKFVGNQAKVAGAIEYAPDQQDEQFFKEVGRSFVIARCSFDNNHAEQRGADICTTRQHAVLAAPRNSEFSGGAYQLQGRVHIADPSPSPVPLRREDKSSIITDNEGLNYYDITSTRQQLEVAYVRQRDPSFCQSAALAMLLNFRRGISTWDDAKVRQMLEAHGAATSHASWREFLSDVLSEFEWGHVYSDDESDTAMLIRAMIDNGFPVVMNVGFTTSGHVILVVGYQLGDKSLELICHDPNGVFSFDAGTYLPDQQSGAYVIYPLRNCAVTLEYRDDPQGGPCQFRKVTLSGASSDWKQAGSPKGPGRYSDWEFVVEKSVEAPIRSAATSKAVPSNPNSDVAQLLPH